MSFKGITLVLFLNLLLAFGFFYDFRNAGALDVSTDLANIIPICKKIDNPALFKNDLYLNDVNDVKYYTPFYVQLLRSCAKLTGGDYFQALNLTSFFTHLLYGITWFFLFYSIKKDYWIALFSSLLFRGVLWPPGGELMGISDLWTIMPRTVFMALVPLPFLAYLYLPKFKIIISALVLGLIVNFHPLTGVGVVIGYFSIFLIDAYFQKKIQSVIFWKELILAIICCLIGMFPYVMTYITNIKSDLNVDQQLFTQAFNLRLPPFFSSPLEFVKLWNRPVLLFFAATFICFAFFDSSKNRQLVKLLFFSGLIIFITANGVVYLEQFVNELLDKNLRMSFQLIRFQKLILVLLEIGFFLLLTELAKRFKISESLKRKSLFGFVLILVFSMTAPFSKLPFIGDDICATILPQSFKINGKITDQGKVDFEKMVIFVKQQTPDDSVFFGNFLLRSAANRSVVLDAKGAGMLIEGNPEKFVAWYQDIVRFEKLPSREKTAFLRNKKVNYILDKNHWEDCELVKTIGEYRLYKL
ncbi:hypothetical protein LZZ90_06970 [Flavobacterium sp. SM15]|uniref:hypothetical protein n=1 Tax=Flavobacterium sp. SM15 TaxID=2908005 RepID=UPI001EDA8E32|nr:hypothetical protein [Flavobacterium sp. SM15]MCG2611243.1 hypothetical protein [Flavobacterium sp. SM15]